MAVSDPIIKRQGDRLFIRLPARAVREWTWVLSFLFAAPFILFGLLWIAPQSFGTRVTIHAPAGYEWVARGMASAFGGCFVLLGGSVVAKALINRFGHIEIILTKGRIRRIDRAGFLFSFSSRFLATLTGLDIVDPPFQQAVDGVPLMNLEAYFSDASPFTLASLYPAHALRPIARELVGAAVGYGALRKVMFGSQPLLSQDRTATASSPQQPADKNDRLRVEQSKASVRLTLEPFPWMAAVWPPVLTLAVAVALVVSNAALKTTTVISILFGVDLIYCLAPLIFLAGLAVAFAMRTRYVVEADGDGLRVNSQSPLRRSFRQWPAAEIDRLLVETITGPPSKGASETARVLVLQLQNGKRRRLPCLANHPNLDWICQVLNTKLHNSEANLTRASRNQAPA